MYFHLINDQVLEIYYYALLCFEYIPNVEFYKFDHFLNLKFYLTLMRHWMYGCFEQIVYNLNWDYLTYDLQFIAYCYFSLKARLTFISLNFMQIIDFYHL